MKNILFGDLSSQFLPFKLNDINDKIIVLLKQATHIAEKVFPEYKQAHIILSQ